MKGKSQGEKTLKILGEKFDPINLTSDFDLTSNTFACTTGEVITATIMTGIAKKLNMFQTLPAKSMIEFGRISTDHCNQTNTLLLYKTPS